MGPFSGTRTTSKLGRDIADLNLGDGKGKAAAPALFARPVGSDPAKAFVKDLTTKLGNR